MIQREQFPGMMRGLQQQAPQPMPPQQPAMPQWGGAGPNSMSQLQGRGQLQGLAQKLGQQSWGDPGPGAAVVQNPAALRQGPMPQQVAQGAQQYAQGQAQGMVNDRDPRFSGAVR